LIITEHGDSAALVQPLIEGSADHILQEMFRSVYGEHNLLIYQDLSALKETYSRYFRSRLQNNKEIILFFSTYQNIHSVRDTLIDAGVDVTKFEREGSLLILDSVRTYFGSEFDILSTIKILSKRAENQGKEGCCAIADMGLFYDSNELLKLETAVSLKFDSVRCKGFCCYHQAYFNRLADNEKQLLFEHHYRNLIIAEPIYQYDEMISPYGAAENTAL
jgi:hypothetical protein